MQQYSKYCSPFLVFSGDGVIKIWDRDKTLLREIMMNETLTVACFLNTRGTVIVIVNKKRCIFTSVVYESSFIPSLLFSGDILIGFKQHIFIIPSEKGNYTDLKRPDADYARCALSLFVTECFSVFFSCDCCFLARDSCL